MKYLIPLWTTLAIELVNPAKSLAECVEVISIDPAKDFTCVSNVMIHGKRGTWFDLQNTLDIIRMKHVYPELELQVNNFAFANNLAKREIATLKDSIHLLEDTNKALVEDMRMSDKEKREAVAELNDSRVWYKHPAFWAAVGFLAGVGTYSAIQASK